MKWIYSCSPQNFGPCNLNFWTEYSALTKILCRAIYPQVNIAFANTHRLYVDNKRDWKQQTQLKSIEKIPSNRETTCPGLVASYSQTGIYSLYHHIDFKCISCSQTHLLSLGNPHHWLLCSHTYSMVLDEDIDQEQDTVTSRLWRITFCFVLCEFIPRQVFTPCFTTMVSTVLVVLTRFGCLRVTVVE